MGEHSAQAQQAYILACALVKFEPRAKKENCFSSLYISRPDFGDVAWLKAFQHEWEQEWRRALILLPLPA